MHRSLAGLALALTVAGAAAPSQAADLVAAPGRCRATINDRVVSTGRHCSQLVLREDTANGRLTLVFDFQDGFHLELAGPALSIGNGGYRLTPDQMTYANPGQTNPQTLTASPAAPLFRGRCSIVRDPSGAVLLSMDCRVGTPIGRIDAEYRPLKVKK